MNTFDEQPLDRAPQQLDEAPGPARRNRTPLVIVALVGLIAGIAAAWWWTRQPAVPSPTQAAAAGSDAAIAPNATTPRPLPPVAQMDTFLRALLRTLSAHPDLARWLATDDLIYQMANGIDRISRGQSPARDVQVLRPKGEFTVARRGGVMTVEPASFQRYDGLASLVDSLDARAVAGVYQTIQPRLDEAYRALGRSEGSVDDAVHVALQRLIDTPVPTEPVRVISGRGATYAYADPAFETLLPVQKQLVRMGPDNTRRIQAKLRAVLAELTRSDSRVR